MAKLPALPFIRRSVTAGLSANQSYREFQETARGQGLQGLRRQDYLRLYSETRTARGAAATAVSMPRDVLPSPEQINRRTYGAKTKYGSWVMIYQRAKGETDIIAQPWMIGSDELITPEEAERRAGAAIASNPYEYDRTLLGIGYIGTDQYQF